MEKDFIADPSWKDILMVLELNVSKAEDANPKGKMHRKRKTFIPLNKR